LIDQPIAREMEEIAMCLMRLSHLGVNLLRQLLPVAKTGKVPGNGVFGRVRGASEEAEQAPDGNDRQGCNPNDYGPS